MPLTQQALSWLESRGVSRWTSEQLGVDSDIRVMEGRRCDVIKFPYRRGRDLVNAKFRSYPDKSFSQVEGGEQRYWNLDAVLQAEAKTVYIVEGELDLCSLVEAGVDISEVISVPNGAPAQASDSPENQERYAYVDAGLKEGLSKVEKFVIATDNDGPGRALRHDLVKLLGPARCWFVDWPSEIKDANDFLIGQGVEALHQFVVEKAQVWPVVGLYTLDQLPEPPPLELWYAGFPEWENKLAFAAQTMSVVTGQPGHGKTSLMMQLWYQICRNYGLKVAIASFETRAKPHHRRAIRQFISGKREHAMSDGEMRAADRWNNEHMLWITHPNSKPTLGWVLDMAEVAVIRHRARVIQIDPWNKLEADRPDGMRETDWIGECLDQIMDFARDMNCHVQVLAHPSKAMDTQARKRPPVLEDIAGSKHWENKTDHGLCVYRPMIFENGERKTAASLFVLKARYEELGYPCKFDLDYKLDLGRYVSVDYQTAMEARLDS